MLYAEDEITQAPVVDEETIREILQREYGITEGVITVLTGYEDNNVKISDAKWEAGIDGPQEVIVKVTNPIEARDTGNIDGQYTACSRLRIDGIPAPVPIPTKTGHNWTMQKVTEEESLPVRVYQVLPGKNLENFEFTEALTKEVGRTIAKVHESLDRLDHVAGHVPFISPENVLCMKREANTLEIKKILNEDQKKQLFEAFRDLENHIFKKRESFEEGLIHSDFNETNLLIDDDAIHITGVLDFGDMHMSLRIFDIAAAILYLHLSDRLHQGVTILASNLITGYRSIRPFSHPPSSLLVAMRARLACSLIYGLRTARINYRGGSVEYVLKTQSNGWETLKELSQQNLDKI